MYAHRGEYLEMARKVSVVDEVEPKRVVGYGLSWVH